MKKSLLCLILSAVMLCGMLSSVVSADFVSITSVKISDLDYPVVGDTFDLYFSLPDVHKCYYAKDASKYEKAIVWYDLGLDGSWMHELDATAVAETGHIYMAEIYLQSEGSSELAEFNFTHGRFDLNHVTVDVDCFPELKVVDARSVITSDSRMKAQITYYASTVFDALHGVYVDLDAFPSAGETPITHTPTSVLTPEYFTMRAEWFLKGQNYDSVSPLAGDYVFKAGELYNLRLVLDCGPKGIFDPSAIVTVADLVVDNVYATTDHLVADISFAVDDGMLTVEGIRAPRYGEAPQTEGFTSNKDVGIFGNWFYTVDGFEFPQPFTKEAFEPGHVYYLQLSIKPNSGYSLKWLTEDKVELNLGKVYSFAHNGDDVIVQIEFAIEPSSVIPGDVNGDGKVNARDVIMAMQAVVASNVGSPMPAGFIFDAADVFADGRINSRDVIGIMNLVIAASK